MEIETTDNTHHGSAVFLHRAPNSLPIAYKNNGLLTRVDKANASRFSDMGTRPNDSIL